MSNPERTFYDVAMEEGGQPVSAGRAASGAAFSITDEELRRLQEAWNDPAFYEFVKDDGFVGAGWVPKPTAEPSQPDAVPKPSETNGEALNASPAVEESTRDA